MNTWRGRTLYLGSDSSGVDVQYVKGRKVLRLGGWYDHIAGIESKEIPLAEFLRGLGVTLKDCTEALKQVQP